MDSNFVFDPIYTNKKEGEEDEEEEEEEEVEQKRSKKKSHRKDAGAEAYDDSVPTPPLTDHDIHSGFKLKLKLPKPMIPEAPDQSKSKKPEVSSDGKKKKRIGEEAEEIESTTRSGMKLKIKSGKDTPEHKVDAGALKKPKPEPTTKRHSPPRREDSSAEKKETRLLSHEKRERPKRIVPIIPHVLLLS
jgi:hypothetical protein